MYQRFFFSRLHLAIAYCVLHCRVDHVYANPITARELTGADIRAQATTSQVDCWTTPSPSPQSASPPFYWYALDAMSLHLMYPAVLRSRAVGWFHARRHVRGRVVGHATGFYWRNFRGPATLSKGYKTSRTTNNCQAVLKMELES